VAASRAKLAGARTPEEAMKANAEVTSALSRLLVVVENYPQLKADQTFTRLMDELAGAENRIAVERMRYNEAVSAYNTTIRVFPSNIVAGIGGFAPKPFFEAEARAKEVRRSISGSRAGYSLRGAPNLLSCPARRRWMFSRWV